ncbi:hypothetical protein DVA67_018055 [Solirubrobacter sp. CPCC 204708]|uniref:Uncharacterized protein n=1 Tax=Solirubrobacter deserti TaxID=2282478 RepID=A0ABT4RCS6_9ACTN|nr:hypothetical protein [Solirubrobacter deserti]MBE2317891.1 hypothetical protein [Solirubrobacter deserti]MDA0136332.1 hypothetical protein [Solirubrobacter deserti]
MDLIREQPNTDHFERYDGEPMVQSFRVGELGYVWITTAEAMTVPGFGIPWIAGQLARYDADELARAVAGGLRLRAGALVPA